jgi:hypothetical protein
MVRKDKNGGDGDEDRVLSGVVVRIVRLVFGVDSIVRLVYQYICSSIFIVWNALCHIIW